MDKTVKSDAFFLSFAMAVEVDGFIPLCDPS